MQVYEILSVYGKKNKYVAGNYFHGKGDYISN